MNHPTCEYYRLLHQHRAQLHNVTLRLLLPLLGQQELALKVPVDIDDRIEVVTYSICTQHLAQLHKVTFGQQEVAITVPGRDNIDSQRAEAVTKGHV